MIKEAAELIKKAKRIGIVLPDAVDADNLGSAFGLLNVLKGAKHEVTLFFSKPVPPACQFLNIAPEKKTTNQPTKETSSPHNLVISINTAEHPIQEVRYEKEGAVFSIILTPKGDGIKKENVEFYSGGPPLDLFIAIDVASPEELPDSFDEHLENFSKKPVIAITQKRTEEFFSDANIYGGAGAALAESIYLLAEELHYAISSEAATCILAGIIEKTKNFSLGAPGKNTLSAASALVALGADKTLVISNLFPQKNETKTTEAPKEKSAPHNLLQLWGRALVRSRYDEIKRVVWSFVPQEDFAKTNTASQDIVFVIKKMAEHIPASRLGIFFLENPHKNHVRAIVSPQDATLEKKFMEHFGDLLEKKQNLLIFKSVFPGFVEAENYLLEFLGNIV